jgi:hypothetical protein
MPKLRLANVRKCQLQLNVVVFSVYIVVAFVARMREGRGACRILVERPEGKRPLGRPRRRWEDNIKMDLQEVGLGGGMDWIQLAEDRNR